MINGETKGSSRMNSVQLSISCVLPHLYFSGGTKKKYKMPIPISEDAQTKLKGVDFD
jgi:hypothetical protein